MNRLSRNTSYPIPTDIAAIERLLSELEPRLERLRGMATRTSSDVVSAAGRAQEAVAGALGDLGDFAGKLGTRARTTGDEASKLGKDFLGKVVDEVEYRPIATLLVAVGIGLLLGMGVSARRG
jgi:ElaB/YqjD/DUF883 family membrane-anchored ribosome-binding protein